eukprot:Unigene12297_Nuclearia_a/m.37362 Unigene12297_Nuclearia_a/g.37362  ORF Unigene12297_Nuclearia_a/g.37362 Unigene12297_Nuclearia_a/m.37362 type:complete len:241 (-) Unigene12297_Nuclearia_a:85-807(-)
MVGGLLLPPPPLRLTDALDALDTGAGDAAAADDLRAHLCLMALPPFGRSFAAVVEAQALLALAPLVHVVPVVARAECLAEPERLARRELVADVLRRLQLPLPQPPAAATWPLFVPTLVAGETVRTYPWSAGADVARHEGSDVGVLQRLLWTPESTAQIVGSTRAAVHARFRRGKRDRLLRLELGLDDAAFVAQAELSADDRAAELAHIDAQLAHLQHATDALERRREALRAAVAVGDAAR